MTRAYLITVIQFLRTVTRPVSTHRRVLSPHLNQKLYSRNPFYARCTKNTSYVSYLRFATKLFLITNDSSTNCFDGTTNYSTPRRLFSKIPKLSFEIVIFLSVDACFLDNLFFWTFNLFQSSFFYRRNTISASHCSYYTIFQSLF